MTLELKVGGVYKNRVGERVEIESYDDNEGYDSYPYVSSCGYTFTSNGSFNIPKTTSRDLIEEWEDTVEEWHEPTTPDTYTLILEGIVGPDVCKIARQIEEKLK